MSWSLLAVKGLRTLNGMRNLDMVKLIIKE